MYFSSCDLQMIITNIVENFETVQTIRLALYNIPLPLPQCGASEGEFGRVVVVDVGRRVVVGPTRVGHPIGPAAQQARRAGCAKFPHGTGRTQRAVGGLAFATCTDHGRAPRTQVVLPETQ